MHPGDHGDGNGEEDDPLDDAGVHSVASMGLSALPGDRVHGQPNPAWMVLHARVLSPPWCDRNRQPGVPRLRSGTSRGLARRHSTAHALTALGRDPDILRLDAIAPPFDPLEVLAWARRERPHTRFLAWLLDPDDPRPGGGHGLGTSFLHGLVTHAVRAIETLPGLDPDDLPRDPQPIDPGTVTVVREQPVGDGIRVTARAPDVRVTWRDARGTPWLLLVECKIDAAEGDGQVREYLAWARTHHPDARRLLAYVTPDGRAPVSRAEGEVVVSLAWPEVAQVGLAVVAHAAPRMEASVHAFVTSVLTALQARFGGREDARALVESLHDRHPRAAALVASPALEPSALDALRARVPRAVWHLQTVHPRAHPWTRAWTERVAHAFAMLTPAEGRTEPWPVLVPGAPHADCPDMASWSLGDITACLGLYVLCTAGRAHGSARPCLWLALRSPGSTATETFSVREQSAAVDALDPATRTLLLDAVPVQELPPRGAGCGRAPRCRSHGAGPRTTTPGALHGPSRGWCHPTSGPSPCLPRTPTSGCSPATWTRITVYPLTPATARPWPPRPFPTLNAS